MDFTLTSDQAALSSAIDRMATQFTAMPTEFDGFARGRDRGDQDFAVRVSKLAAPVVPNHVKIR